MKGSSFIFERVDLLYYHLHKISLNRALSYIDSPEWLKAKGATINPKNKNNECFKYAIAVALNLESIGKNLQKIKKLSLSPILIIGMIKSFHRILMTGKNLNKIIGQLLLISYMYHTILNI